MLLHLPIVILATLSPIPVSTPVPQFDIARECHFEGGPTSTFDRCSRDETAALSDLKSQWAQFGDTDHKGCVATTTIGGFASYVELLTCLEMARDGASPSTNPNDSYAKSGHGRGGQDGVTVGEGK